MKRKGRNMSERELLLLATFSVIVFSILSFFIVFGAEARTVLTGLVTSSAPEKNLETASNSTLSQETSDVAASTEGTPVEYVGDPNDIFSSDVTIPTSIPMPTPVPTPVPTPAPNLVEYTGPVYHMFFHPLIYRPELAFDGDYSAKGMDDYMATTTEFKNIIKELYKNGYVLADLEEFYGYVTQEDGSVKYKRRYIPFPENKKPLIISVDDANYYSYMRENGCVYKLVLDENGNVRDYTVDDNGNEILGDDRDLVTILDKFVAEHPDFSFNGVKGLLAPTGFDGTLGYQTQSGSANRESEIEECKRVIARLKETGWRFASHSYAHAHMSKMTKAQVRADAEQWLNEVGSLVGETSVWIYPYGEAVKNGTEAHNALENAGFRIFCGVGPKPYEQIRGETVFQDRMNVDGISLRRPDDSYFKDMFVNSEVIDLKARIGEV